MATLALFAPVIAWGVAQSVQTQRRWIVALGGLLSITLLDKGTVQRLAQGEHSESWVSAPLPVGAPLIGIWFPVYTQRLDHSPSLHGNLREAATLARKLVRAQLHSSTACAHRKEA